MILPMFMTIFNHIIDIFLKTKNFKIIKILDTYL